MLNTHAMQILLQYQDSGKGVENSKFDKFLEEFRVLAEEHDINFEKYESFNLPGSEYRIAHCDRCKDLTINKDDLDDSVKEMVPFFWENIREGNVTKERALCQICKTATS
jgi:hypothetical protein